MATRKKKADTLELFGGLRFTHVSEVLKDGKDWQPLSSWSRIGSHAANGFDHILVEEKLVPRSENKNWQLVKVSLVKTDPDVAGRLEPIKGREGYWRFSGPIAARMVSAVRHEWTVKIVAVAKAAAVTKAKDRQAMLKADDAAKKADAGD